ncbi:MAG TPA: PQQ-binding-like beta-propeller repeat protein [Ilumatobacter sp.]|nr:PQQ-binding-like beta-propeller repeat protein [Ilumatobacter sp.]
MPERSIEELLGQLPEPSPPAPDFEARLRARLAAELRAETAPDPHPLSNPEVIELQTLTRTPADPKHDRRTWLKAAAVVLVAGGVVTALVLAQRDGESPATDTVPDATTAPAPVETTSPVAVETTNPAEVETTSQVAVATTVPALQATFAGATVDAFAVDPGSNPYFVGAADDVWVSSLAGELVRLDSETGEIVARATVPESSPFAVDADAVWVADAIGGDVIRLDLVDGTEVARIATGVEILENSYRQPMLPGAARSFAQVGGIASSGDAVWVGDKAGVVMRIDPSTDTITARFDVPVRPDLLRVEGEVLLVVNQLGGEAAAIDTTDGTVLHEVSGLDDIAGAALYGGATYLHDRVTGTVTRTDLSTGEQRTSAALGAPLERSGEPTLPTGLAVSGAGVLVDTKTTPNNLHVLDPVTLEEIGTLTTTADQGDMAIAGDGSVWLVRSLANEVVRITPAAL